MEQHVRIFNKQLVDATKAEELFQLSSFCPILQASICVCRTSSFLQPAR